MQDVYKMTVNLSVLEHLGINLYSNIAAVLTEAVANSWDADAENCNIRVDQDQDLIEIADDGIGMDVNDINDKYLKVGYRKREDRQCKGGLTAKGRPIMGRKGLGKLSLFSIAKEIEVQSVKGDERHGFVMTIDGIQGAFKKGIDEYVPTPLSHEKIDVTEGTLLRLRKIKRERLGKGITALRKKLSRRFSVIGETHRFNVSINGKPLLVSDRGDLPQVQFLWFFGDEEPDLSAANKLQEKNKLPDKLDEWDHDMRVTGWLGTSRYPKDLDDEDAGNLNSIVVFARGRLFHENILDKLNDGRLYTKYLTGQIEADFLDDDDKDDIATSDRQRVQEDDPRYIELLDFLKRQTNTLEAEWSGLRRKYGVEKAKKEIPVLNEWLERLKPGFKESAEKLIAAIGALPIEKEEDRRLVYRHGVIAFERMKLRGSAEEFADKFLNVETLLKLLSDRDDLEAVIYRDIVMSRLDVIKRFSKHVDENVKEKVLQESLFDNLWLIDPTWERASGSERIEKTLKTDYRDFSSTLTEEESKGRMDIRYRTSVGKHIIVELKKADRSMSLVDLMDQGQKYYSGLKKCLHNFGKKNPEIEIVFVLGRPVKEQGETAFEPTHVQDALRTIKSRTVFYNEMIENAQKAYAEFIEHTKTMDSLDDILSKI